MKKINKTHLSVAVLLLVVLLFPLMTQYKNFIFHTYETKVFQKSIYYGLHDLASVDYYSLVENEKGYQLGKAKVIIKDENFIHEGDEIEMISLIDDHSFEHVLEKEDLYHYNLDLITDKNLGSVSQLTLEIKNKTTGQTLSIPLNPSELNIYTGQNKDFTVKELYVYKNRIQLGSINCANIDQWKKEYDNVRIEYRYKKPESTNNDQYVVFYKQTGTIDEIFNHYSADRIDVKMPEDILLQNLDLSIVIVLEGENDLAFSINLSQVNEVKS